MSSFLSRLASRVVAPVVASPTAPHLQPLGDLSPFSPGPVSNFGLIEEHVERVAQPDVSPEAPTQTRVDPPTVPPEDLPAPPPSQAATAPELDTALTELRSHVFADDFEPPDAGRAPRDDSPEPAEVEVREVPGPVVPVVRRVMLPAADTRGPTARETKSSFPSVTVVELEPTVKFVPGDPLGRMGLDPLQPEEILAHPQVAEVVERDSTVNVHIGRLEVARPVPPPMPSPAQRNPDLLSLDDYLAERGAATGARGGR